MFEPISTAAIMALAGEIFKVWVPTATALVGAYKGFQWVKTKIVNIDANVVATKDALNVQMTAIQNEIKSQTHALTAALNEQRADFRTFYLPFMLQNQQFQQPAQVPARAKKTVQKRVKKA
jgi:hypothetical protein